MDFLVIPWISYWYGFHRDSNGFARDSQSLDWKRYYGFEFKLELKQAQNQLHKGGGPKMA